MALLLNWRVWAAILLCVAQAAFGWKMYKAGGNSVQVEFDMYKNQQVLDTLAAQKANQLKEQGMQLSLENLTNAYIKNQKANSASAVAAGNSLRDLQATLDSPAAQDSPASRSVDAGAGPVQELLGNCAATLVRMAQEADGLENQVVGLQSYVKQVVNPAK
jgi:hypothetical protein